MKKTHSKLHLFALILPLIIFPFGEILKFTVSPGLKISLLEMTLFLVVTYRLTKGKLVYNNSAVAKPAAHFILWCLVSIALNSILLINTNQILPALFYTARYILYFLYYLIVLELLAKDKDKSGHNSLSLNLFFSLSFIAIFGIIQYLLYPDLRNLLYLGWDPHFYRLFSTLFDPNFVGVIIAITIIYFLCLNLSLKNIWQKLLLFILFTTNSLALYLTRSRTAYLSLIVGLITFLIYKWRTKKTLYILLVVGVIAGGYLLPKPNVDVFRIFRLETSISRVNNWSESIKLGVSHPLVGIGFGSQRFADSSLLYVFYATGIVGFILFLRIWYQILRFAYKNNSVLLLASTCILLSSSFFNNTLFYPWLLFMFYFILALEEARLMVRK